MTRRTWIPEGKGMGQWPARIHGSRKCGHCGKALPEMNSPSSRYCNVVCRNRAYDARKKKA